MLVNVKKIDENLNNSSLNMISFDVPFVNRLFRGDETEVSFSDECMSIRKIKSTANKLGEK